MFENFLSLVKVIGLPVSICCVVLYRVDHYVGRLLNIFSTFSASLDDLTTEIKNLKYFIHVKDPNESCRPKRPE